MSGVADYAKADVVDAVRNARARTLARLESLNDGQWETIVTPGWRVREVAAHLITTDEASLTGRLLALGFRQRPMEDIERWNDEQVARWADKPIPAILHGLDVWGRRMCRAFSVAPGLLMRPSIPTPFGTVSVGWLGMLRAYDEWVHGEDVRRALDLPAADDLEAVGPAARQLFATIPVQTLHELPPDARGRVQLVYRDLADVPPFGVDMGARRYGSRLCEDGTTIAGDAATLIMVAAGRDSWRDAEAEGKLTIAGPREPAEVFLDHLRAV